MKNKEDYKVIIQTALEELHELEAERLQIESRHEEITERIKHLRELLGVLSRMYKIDIPGITSKSSLADLNLIDAIRTVLRLSVEPLTPVEIKEWLKDAEFDIDKYSNPLAVIHTTLKRMDKNAEVKEETKKGKKTYRLLSMEEQLLRRMADGNPIFPKKT
jgi:hypothetical protein